MPDEPSETPVQSSDPDPALAPDTTPETVAPDAEPAQIDFAAAGLLDGLEGVQRAERLALLRYLAADGVPLAELQRTTASGTLMFLPAERVIGGRARYSAREIAERTGTELDFLIAVRRAMGLPIPGPDEAVYTDGDLESVSMTGVFREAGVSEEEILDLMRTLGRGLGTGRGVDPLAGAAARARARG